MVVPIVAAGSTPVFLLIAAKAAHMRELEMSDKAIARALGVSDKTVAKAVGAVQHASGLGAREEGIG